MNNKHYKTKLLSIIVLFFCITGLSLAAAPADENINPLFQHLQAMEKLIIFQPVWDNFKFREGIEKQEFSLPGSIQGFENACGVKVLDTPLHLKLKVYSRGLSQVEVWVEGQCVDTFEINGSSGTGTESEKEVVVTPTTAAKTYKFELKVKNKGFSPPRTEPWPPRRKPLEESGIYFTINEASITFPACSENHQALEDWLLSMKIGYALLNPDFHRYTFIGQPFEIKDGRKTPKPRLMKLNKTLENAAMALTPSMLQANEPGSVINAIKKSYQLSTPIKEFAKEFKIYLVGNAHIDIAWLWRMRETVMVARNTFDTVLNNMEEYPELRYAQSQALTYQWMEKQYPELFQRIKKAVKDGKWEIVGGMWVEPDCNLISGESWVRQLLYGKRYFKEKFDIEVDTGWNPDSFGYNWNMPQIYSKSGIKRFITQKIGWNDTTVFPHFIFWWQGVDDTKLLTYFPPVGYTASVKMPEELRNITRYEATTGYKKTLLLYGLGDHGGGPNREILDRVRSYKNLHISPDFIHSKSIDFLKNLELDLKTNIPVWNDELYLEYHRGTYTTQAKVKKNNRESESLLSAAEKWASISSLLNNTPYPAELLEKAWKVVLTNQFHDILPGSSINPVYRDAIEDYEENKKVINASISGSLKAIAGKINTGSIDGTPVIIFNPLSWKRSDVVSLPFSFPAEKQLEIRDSQDRSIPVSIQRESDSPDVTLSFLAGDVPPLGYSVFTIKTLHEYAPKDPVEVPGFNAIEDDQSIQAENNFFIIRINKITGNISSIWDRRLRKEWVSDGKEANALQVYEDYPENWDAWDIGYTGRMWDVKGVDSVELIENSQVKKVIKIKKSFLGLSKDRYEPTEYFPSSFFTHYITIYNNLDRIDIKTEADWWEDHMLLKAVFPVNVKNDWAAYEIPFASIKRTTRFETLWEKARYEVSALRWADLSDEKGGISLLNDCKYGCDIHGNVMRISLLRAPTWPDPMADRGKHTWVYSIYPHAANPTLIDTIQRAQGLNIPLSVMETDKHNGDLPLESGFFNVQSDTVILDTIKKAEDDNCIILRFYESAGKESDAAVSITGFKNITKIIETDLMEKPITTIPVTNNSFGLKLKKYEIKTLKLYF